ncbi:MAG: PrgI family protein, partial [Oscillospiraceae bacterium]|nr:PrgI family protein [Oscillospiraceae bacterium]
MENRKYVKLPIDLGSIKKKFFLGLSRREFFAFLTGGAMGIIPFFVVKSFLGVVCGVFALVLFAAPAVVAGLYHKQGIFAEQLLKIWLQYKKKPKLLVYKAYNTAYIMSLQHTVRSLERKLRMSDKGKIILSKEEKKAIKARISEVKSTLSQPSTQNSIPFSDMTKDGICIVPGSYFGKGIKLNYYTKSIRFGDINYQLVGDEEQTNIFSRYCDIMNYFDSSVHFQLTFESRKRDNEVLVKKLVIPPQEDNFNNIRKEYSDMLVSKLTEGDNGNELVKFLTFGVSAKNIREARNKLNSLSAEIIRLFEKADVEAWTLNGEERLSVLYRALNPYRRNRFLFNWDYMRKIGSSPKDYIAPSSLDFSTKRDFKMGDCYGSVMCISLLANELSDRILFEFLEQNQLLCLNIHVEPFDLLDGQNLVKNDLLNLKMQKVDKQQKLYREGGDIENIPLNMQENIDELAELYKDVKSKDERLFNITLTVRTYAKNEKQLKQYTETLRRLTQNKSCMLFPLDYQQENALCASLPLGVNKIPNMRILHTSSLAVFVPFTSVELFHIDSLRASYYGINSLTRNMIIADKSRLKNPNSLLLGTPGAGKSFAGKREIIDVFLRTNDDICISDPEGEYFPTVEALEGQVIRLYANSEDFLNPMDIIIDKDLNAEDDPIPDKIEYIISIMELIVGGREGLTSTERSMIDRCAGRIYKDFLNDNPTAEKMPILQ